MTRGENNTKRWQVGMSDLLVFVPGVSISFGLVSLAFQPRVESHEIVKDGAPILGVFTLGGSIGACFGRFY